MNIKPVKIVVSLMLLCALLPNPAFASGPLKLIATVPVDPEGTAGAVDGCEFSKDGVYFAATDNHGVARIYRTSDCSLVGEVTHKYDDHTCANKDYELNAVVWSHDGRYLATGRNDDGAKVWKTNSFSDPSDFAKDDVPYKHLKDKDGSTHYETDGADFSPNNQWLATAADKYLMVYRLPNFKEIQAISAGGGAVNSVDFSYDSSLVAFAASNGKVQIVRTSDWTIIKTLTSTASIKSVRFSPDAKYLVFSGRDQRCMVYRTSDWSLAVNIVHSGNMKPLPCDDDDSNPAVEASAWSSDGAYLLTSGLISGELHVWDTSVWPASGSITLGSKDALAIYQAQEAKRAIEFIDVFGNKVIVGGDEGNVRMYEFTSAASPKQANSAKRSSQEYVEFDLPPLLLLTAGEAAKIPGIVATGAFAKPYKTLIADADAFLDDRPNPLETIIYEGRVSNDPDRLNSARHLHDMNKIYALTWASFVSGKSVYGAKAIDFVEAWAKKYKPTGNAINDHKILECMLAYQLLKSQMSESQKTTISNWIKAIGDVQKNGWRRKSGNHAAKRLKLIYFEAYLENDQDRIDWVQKKVQIIWNGTLYKNGETDDFKRRDAVHYHMSSVKEFLQIAQIGRLLGKDHYNQKANNGGSIAKSIEFFMPFVKGEKIHPEWVNSIVKLDHQRWQQAHDPYYKPGKPWDPWEAYESLLLASTFDHSMYHWAEKLRQAKGKPLPWLAVLAKASQTDD